MNPIESLKAWATTQTRKVAYLNALRKVVGLKLPKNEAGVAIVSDFDILVAEPEDHAAAMGIAVNQETKE